MQLRFALSGVPSARLQSHLTACITTLSKTSRVFQRQDVRQGDQRAEWRPTLAGCKAIIHQHLDTTLTLMIAEHRVGHYNAEGKLLTPLTKKQIKAVEKTLRGKVQKQTFPLNLQIPQTTQDSHFPTATTTTTG
jgi:hypothetical protein